MGKLLLMCFAFGGAGAVVAQTTDTIAPPKHWKIGGTTSFTFSQVSLTNWSAGGKNSIAGTFLFKSYYNYKKDKISWDSNFDLGYGLTQQGDDNPIKTEDKLLMATKLGYSAGKNWFYSALADFKTQMDNGYKDPPTNSVKISEFMAPAYLTVSLGMDYKPSDNFSFYISPVTTKTTIVLDDTLSNAGAYGVDPGDKSRSEFGAYLKMIAKKKDLVKNVDFSTRADFFSNLADSPQNIDIDWEILFMMKVNKYLSAMASFNLLYDDDIKYVDKDNVTHGARTQLKQLFGFGLTYNFGQ
ncbi:MAG: DUF3078 domain-containing protein [Breznakibacter sp.]